MKKMFIILLVLIVYNSGMAQYTVTKVIGLVKNKTSGEILKAGSKLGDDDILTFSSPNDIVRVIVAGKGIYVISPSTKPEGQQNEIVEMLRSALHVKFKEGYLSGRSGNEDLVPAVLETQEMMNTRNLIGEENKYNFDAHTYNTSRGRFFLQIESPGSGAIIHPLRTILDTLLLFASDFNTENKIDPQKASYKLGFFSKEKNTSESLVLIRPYIDSAGEMETVMRLVIEENKEADRGKIQQACYSEVYAALGKPSAILFKDVFNNVMTQVSKK